MQKSLIAVVLAGGKSSRMGQDKATRYSTKLQTTMIEQSLSLLTQLNNCDVLISSNTYPGGIKDIIADCGPLSGIHAVLSALQKQNESQNHTQGFLFIPVDMPKLSVTMLEALINFAQLHQSAAYPNNSYLPLYMPAKQTALSLVTQQLQGKDWSIRRFLTQIDARSMPQQDNSQLININNPHDWQQHCV